MSLDLYHSLLDIATTQPNIDLLVKIWYDSLTLDKKDMIELNERILEAIPELRKMLGLPESDSENFQQFVEDYDEHQYNKQCSEEGGSPNECLEFFSKKGDWRNMRKAIEKGANDWNFGIKGAAEGGWKDLVDFFWKKIEEKNPTSYSRIHGANIGMLGATSGGYLELVNFFISKSANDWFGGLLNAATNGHLDLVKFFLTNTSNFFINDALSAASRGGHREIIDFLIEEGANNWNRGMLGAARGGHKDLVLFFEKKGADNWDGVMASASSGGHLDIVKLAEQKGSKNWEEALISAVTEDRLEIIKYLVSSSVLTTDNLKEALINSSHMMHEDIVEFLFTILPPDQLSDFYDPIIYIEPGREITNLDAALIYAINNETFAAGRRIEFVIRLLETKERTIDLNLLLEIAAKNGSLELVKYLIEMGATDIERVLYLLNYELEGEMISERQAEAIIEYLEAQREM